jgi:hypothetical protein
MVVHRPARIRYYTGDTLTFTSSEQPSSAASGPPVSWLDPEGPHSVENIDGPPLWGLPYRAQAALTAELGRRPGRGFRSLGRVRLAAVGSARQRPPDLASTMNPIAAAAWMPSN